MKETVLGWAGALHIYIYMCVCACVGLYHILESKNNTGSAKILVK